MKTYPFMVIMIMLFSSFMSGSQTDDSALVRWKKAMSENDEYIHALLVADRNVLENAKVIIHNLKSKKAVYNAMVQYHTDEMGRSLETADRYLAMMSKATDIAVDAIYVRYLADLHHHNVRSLEVLREIKAELKKSKPGKSVIIMNATTIYAEMKSAEEEQLKMHEKMEVSEPEEPKPDPDN
jgi:hypothetical protein